MLPLLGKSDGGAWAAKRNAEGSKAGEQNHTASLVHGRKGDGHEVEQGGDTECDLSDSRSGRQVSQSASVLWQSVSQSTSTRKEGEGKEDRERRCGLYVSAHPST